MLPATENNIIRLYIIKLSKWLMLTMPILFLFYRDNGLATQDLFLLKSVYSFSIVVLEVPSGYIGDVWGRKAALTLVEPERKKMQGHTSFSQILAIVRFAVKDHKSLRAAILYSSAMGTATLTMAWFVQPYFAYLALPLALYGILIPVLNLFTGFVSIYAWKVEQKLGRKAVMIFIATGIGGGYLLMGLTGGMAGLFFLFMFYGIRGVATPVLRNQINEITPSDIRATVLSVRNLIIRLAFALLGPVMGWQADRAGVPSALMYSGLFFLAGGLGAAIYTIRTSKAPQTVTQPGLPRGTSGI